MNTSTIDTKEAPKKWWASQDAHFRNLGNKSRWSSATQLRVTRMVMALTVLYSGKVHEAYGKKAPSIKVEGCNIRNRKELRSMEAEWALLGVTKKVSAQGVIYRLTTV